MLKASILIPAIGFYGNRWGVDPEIIKWAMGSVGVSSVGYMGSRAFEESHERAPAPQQELTRKRVVRRRVRQPLPPVESVQEPYPQQPAYNPETVSSEWAETNQQEDPNASPFRPAFK